MVRHLFGHPSADGPNYKQDQANTEYSSGLDVIAILFTCLSLFSRVDPLPKLLVDLHCHKQASGCKVA